MAQIMASHGDWAAIWAAARERMRREMGDATFDAWIAPLTLVSASKDELQIGAPKQFHRNWVANQHLHRIESALKAEGGRFVSISLVVAQQQPVIGVSAPRVSEPAREVAFADPERSEARRSLTHRLLNPAQTFESFIVGP